MRKLSIIVACLLAACAVQAEQVDEYQLSVSVTTNAAEVVTDTVTVRGFVEAIYLDVVTAGTTGNVSIAYSPSISTLVDVTLAADAAYASDTVFRPRIDGTDTAGSGLTDDPPGRYLCIGTITMTCTNSSATNATYKALLQVERK